MTSIMMARSNSIERGSIPPQQQQEQEYHDGVVHPNGSTVMSTIPAAHDLTTLLHVGAAEDDTQGSRVLKDQKLFIFQHYHHHTASHSAVLLDACQPESPKQQQHSHHTEAGSINNGFGNPMQPHAVNGNSRAAMGKAFSEGRGVGKGRSHVLHSAAGTTPPEHACEVQGEGSAEWLAEEASLRQML